mmetsp:Transcript_19676/g.33570  ORF Transcript_19676/g.33570 Transcript_19676/m.33570 type:complete len:637 (+) Transcript_19676:46-1956(+)
MSDEESSQGDDTGGMFTTDAILNDEVEATMSDAANAALLQARKRAKLSSKRSTKSGRSSSSSSRTRPVVKLMVTSVSRSYSEPWRRKPQRESSGTGFLISWGEDTQQPIRVITNAHVVRNATTVRARASFGPHVVSCQVEWLSLPLDLALLRITEGDWNDFCKGWSFDVANGDGNNNAAAAVMKSVTDPASNGNNNVTKLLTLSTGLPKLDENVTCVGFPQGGTQISVTRGVVSRIDVDSQYVLRIQIDAAINPGNSGGPVFDEQGQVVGIASSHLRGAGNIGYIIPSKIVSNFLQMCKDNDEVKVEDRFSGLGALVVQEESIEDSKHVPGIPNLAILGSQTLESKALRHNLGLDELDILGGVRIVGSLNNNNNDSFHTGDRLDGDDVLLSINGIPIGMDGTIQLSETRPDERINFRSLVTCQRVGSKVTLDVLRKKERKELSVSLNMSRFLVPQYDDFDAIPLYVVVGGCVFTPLSLPLVSEKKSNKSTSFSRYYRDQRSGNEQMIVLSKVLNDEVNVGYHGWKNLVLKSVNGFEPKNIQELVDVIVRKMEGEMMNFRCTVVGEQDADYVICMSEQEVIHSENRVLQRHMIASWCSMEAISKELRDEVEKNEPSETKRRNAYHTMKDMRHVLERV